MSPARLAPSTSPDTQFFWDGLQGASAARAALRRVRCAAPPAPIRCARAATHSQWTPIESSGRGTILSAVVMRHPQYPWWFENDPVVVLVELEEGWRLVANLIGVEDADDVMNAPVEVVFEDFDDDVTLPAFRLVGA